MRISDQVARIERQLERLPREKCYVLAPGRRAWSKVGEVSEIRFTQGELERMRGAIVTHNHPSRSSFSPDDVALACRHDLREIRVAASGGLRYSMQPPEGVWTAEFWEEVVRPLVDFHPPQVDNELVREFAGGRIAVEEMNYHFWHRLWVRVARDSGIHYHWQGRE